MAETKTVKQQIEELEKKQKIEELEKKLEGLKASVKKEPEPEEKKERLTYEVFRVLKTNYNWKFVAGALFAWFILWIFNH